MNVVPEKKTLESGFKQTSVVEPILIERGALKTICLFFSLTVKEIFHFVSSVQSQKFSICIKSVWLFVFLSLHKGCTFLEQVRWIYAATELATSDPRRTKLVGRVNSHLEFRTICCVAEDVPSPAPKTFKTSGKKKACTHTIFFPNGLIKMTYT